MGMAWRDDASDTDICAIPSKSYHRWQVKIIYSCLQLQVFLEKMYVCYILKEFNK